MINFTLALLSQILYSLATLIESIGMEKQTKLGGTVRINDKFNTVMDLG